MSDKKNTAPEKGQHSDHSGHDHSSHSGHDHSSHSGHDHSDHSGHDHSSHSGHDHSSHSGHDHSGHGGHDDSAHGGHDHHEHHAHMIQDFKKRFWVSLVLTIPVLALSKMIQGFLGFELSIPYQGEVVFGLATILFFYGGWPFLKGLYDELKSWKPGMMTLIGLAITVAYVYSSAIVFGLPGMDFFWELATLIVIMLLGHWIEMKSVMSASNALQLLVELLPNEAHKKQGDDWVDVSIDSLQSGDVILVRANEKVPADGTIVEGESYIDESLVTGESVPVKRKKEDSVIGGSLNGNSSIQLKVEKTGKDSYLQQVISLVEEAQSAKSKTQNLANKAAAWLAFVAIGAGIITSVGWALLGQDTSFILERTVTVMVISCPHALGLAIPLVVAISTAMSAKNGLLIRNRTAFENSRNISALVFDKTGTLTKGVFQLSSVETFADVSEDQSISIAGGLEQHSEHPIATGLLEGAKSRSLSLPEVTDFETITGRGIQGRVDGTDYSVVSSKHVEEQGLSIPEGGLAGSTEVYLLRGKGAQSTILARLSLADEIRPESKEAVKALRKKGIKLFMATGDSESTAKAVSDELELDGYYSRVMPEKKVEVIKDLQKQGHFVAMTGDGVNDAPALATADIGIAVGSGTDVAASTADIVLVRSNPSDIARLILFGRATYSKMVQNLIWATGYNAIALPLATGFIPGIVISPAVGAVFMSLSTIIVAINAQLLKRKAKIH